MARFPRNEIISMVGEAPRFDLAESLCPNQHVGELLNAYLAELPLGYGSASGDVELRRAHGRNLQGYSTMSELAREGASRRVE